MPLSDMKIRNLKPGEKAFKVADSDGLYLFVSPKGSRLWRMDYTFAKARKTLSFGKYPAVPLLEARRMRDEAKRLLAENVDPGRAKKIERMEAETTSETFRSVADRWFKTNEKQWVGAYAVRLRNRLVTDVYPSIGSTPIADIRPQEVLTCIRKIEARGAIEMARRVYQMVGSIFKFAVGEGIIQSDPTRDISAALAPPNPIKHRNAIKGEELPGLMEKLMAREDTVSSLAVQFVIHTFVRTNELRLAEWTEFENLDGEKPLWRIPKEKMKMRREHLVPLTPPAIAIINRLRGLHPDSRWVFKTPGNKDAPISNNAMLYFLYRLGFSGRATVHGFRSTASTVLNEREFNRDWIEMQLAHVDASIRGVYNSALYLQQRREMMLWWSNYVQPDDFDDIL